MMVSQSVSQAGRQAGGAQLGKAHVPVTVLVQHGGCMGRQPKNSHSTY
jgi:hypothetical protein